MRKLRIVLKENKSILNEGGVFAGREDQFEEFLALEKMLQTSTDPKIKAAWEKIKINKKYTTGTPLGNVANFKFFMDALGQTAVNIMAVSEQSFIDLIQEAVPKSQSFFNSFGSSTDDVSNLDTEALIQLLQDYYKATVLPLLFLNDTNKLNTADYAYGNYLSGVNNQQIKSRIDIVRKAAETVSSRKTGTLAGFRTAILGSGENTYKAAITELARIYGNVLATFVAKKDQSDNLSKSSVERAGGGEGGGEGGEGGGGGGGGEPPTTGTPPTAPPERAGGEGGAGGERPPAGTPIPVSTDLFRALSRSVPRWATAEIIRTLRSELGAAGYPLRESIKSSDSTLDILLKEEMNLLLLEDKRKNQNEIIGKIKRAGVDDVPTAKGKIHGILTLEKEFTDKKSPETYYADVEEIRKAIEDKKKELGFEKPLKPVKRDTKLPSAEVEPAVSPTDTTSDSKKAITDEEIDKLKQFSESGKAREWVEFYYSLAKKYNVSGAILKFAADLNDAASKSNEELSNVIFSQKPTAISRLGRPDPTDPDKSETRSSFEQLQNKIKGTSTKDYFKELVVDKAPEKEAELDKMITQQKGMKEILRDYTRWLLNRKIEAENATKQKVGSPEFEKKAPKFFEKYSRMITATRKLVQLFEDAESDREITDKRAVKMHVEAAFPKSAGFSNNIRELMETMLGERAGSAKDTRRDFQKAPSKGLVKDAGKAGKQVDLKKFQGFISSLRPPEGQKPLANKDAAVNIVRKFLSNYGIKLTESQTIRMINNLISESRYHTKVIKEYREHIQSQLIPYMQKQIGFNKPPVINFLDDTQNASDPFGKTAFYDPQSMEISVYTTGRHPKDIMRSVAHEVIHHAQNCRGQLDPQRMGEASEGYAQKNPYLRKLEEEAYLLGNMTFRDWEDGMKNNQLNEGHDCNKVHPNKSHAAYKRDDEAKEEKSLEEWKNEERWDLLMKRFKIVSEKRFANDPKLDKDGDGKPKWADEDDDNPKDSKKQVKGKK